MKKNIFFGMMMAIIISFTVASSASAQYLLPLSYLEITPADKNWKTDIKTGNYQPLSEDAMLYVKEERCSGWYFQPGASVSYATLHYHNIGSNSKTTARVEAIGGYEFCFADKSNKKHHNFGISAEAKFQLTSMPKLIVDNLAYTRSKVIPTIGANIVVQFPKHKKYRFGAFMGVGYTRLTYYTLNADGETLSRRGLNAASYEAGVQTLRRVLSRTFGIKVGYAYTPTPSIKTGAVFIGATVNFRQSDKKKMMTYREYCDSMGK